MKLAAEAAAEKEWTIGSGVIGTCCFVDMLLVLERVGGMKGTMASGEK